MKKILITGGDGQLGNCFFSMFGEKYKLLRPSEQEFDITNINQVKTIIIILR